MSKQEQTQGFKLSSQNQLSVTDPLKIIKNQSENLSSNDTISTPIQRLRHVYLEQETTYGRFIPFLLLKDKLKSQMDSSGHTALHHMCSHNSEFLPLYLSTIKKHDPILNRPTKLGHTPLDIAGIYCRKQYVDLLIAKGAIDNGNVDHWAIQRGNIYNWTGKIDPTKKHLPHWAAYNNMPEVLLQFYKQGANVNQKDNNDLTPIDLAVINKSYKSIKVLGQLGFRPKQQLLKTCQSKSIIKIFQKLDQSQKTRKLKSRLKLTFVPHFCFLSFILTRISIQQHSEIFQLSYLPALLTFLIWFILTVIIKPNQEPIYPNTRRTQFYSDIVDNYINIKSNLLIYFLLNISIFITGVICLLSSSTKTYLICIFYLIELYITIVYLINSVILFYGAIKNLTHQQMFNSDKCKYLWKKIHYISQRKIFIRKFINPADKQWKQNLKKYFMKSMN